MLVEKRDACVYQTFKSADGFSTLLEARRYSVNNGATWSELEWENPPMVLDVEYRTTERFKNKAVYTVAFDFGNLPNATTKKITKQITFTEIVDIRGRVYGDIAYNPISNLSGLNDVWIGEGSNMIVNALTTEDMSSKTMTLTVKYTKD